MCWWLLASSAPRLISTRIATGELGRSGWPGEDLTVRVEGTDVPHPRGMLVEVAHAVAAQQRKRILPCQVVPQHFETNRGLLVAGPPEHVHHLAIGANHAVGASPAHLIDDG